MDDTKKIIEKYKRELMEMSRAAGGAKTAERSAPEPKREPQVIGYVSGDNKSYDNFLEELGRIPAASEASRNADDSAEGCAEDNADLPDVIFENASDDDPMNNEDPSSEDVREPQFVEDPDGSTTEIIDETIEDGQPIFSAPNYVTVPSTEEIQEEITRQSDPAQNDPEPDASGVTNNTATTPRPDQADAQVTTEEQAERLNDQPVSGTDPDEQLTGRSFEDKAPPPVRDISMEQGSRAESVNFPKAVFKDHDDFLKQNPGKGTILFRVYTGREAVPLESAECVIYTKINGSRYEIARLQTNSSGQTPVQELPAPDRELSQHSENQIQAFALYDAKVTKKGFSQVILEDIPVFDGVQSVQRVFMIVE